MTSNIINMAERMKDDTDRALERLFRSDAIDDDGFSVRVVSRVRRRIWIRRLAMPIAVIIGAFVGLKPLADSVAILSALVAPVAGSLAGAADLTVALAPSAPTMLLGAMLVLSVFMIGRMLED